jgi:hypothetical protein
MASIIFCSVSNSWCLNTLLPSPTVLATSWGSLRYPPRPLSRGHPLSFWPLSLQHHSLGSSHPLAPVYPATMSSLCSPGSKSPYVFTSNLCYQSLTKLFYCLPLPHFKEPRPIHGRPHLGEEKYGTHNFQLCLAPSWAPQVRQLPPGHKIPRGQT